MEGWSEEMECGDRRGEMGRLCTEKTLGGWISDIDNDSEATTIFFLEAYFVSRRES